MRRRGSPAAGTIIILIGLITLVPFYFMIAAGFKTDAAYLEDKVLPPVPPTGEHFVEVFQQLDLAGNFLNTVFVLVVTLVPYLIISSAAGFAFAKLRFPGRTALLLLVTGIMVFPQMVLGVQVYILQSRMGILDTRLGLVAAYLGYFAPYATYLMTTYFRNVPDTFIEAAVIDGAGLWKVYRLIMVPIARPMFVTLIIVGSQAIWNELPFALLLLRSSARRTLMPALTLFGGEYGITVPTMSAALMLVSAPMILLYIIAQRQVQRGVLAGGIKE